MEAISSNILDFYWIAKLLKVKEKYSTIKKAPAMQGPVLLPFAD
jgi:hypothetical protein